MSRPVSSGGTLDLVPSSFFVGSNLPITGTNYQASNAYKGTGSTDTYARFAPTSSSTASGYCYYGFSVDIPEGATISSISCSFIASVSNSTGINLANIMLCAGETVKGPAVSFSATTSNTVRSLSSGSTWTRDETINIRLKLEGHKNTSSKRYIRFYGASLTIVWSLNGTEYEVKVTNSTSATTDPTGTTYVYQGLEQKISIGNIPNTDGINIKDNNVDVTGQLVSGYSEGTTIFVPSSLASSTRTVTNPNNGLTDSASTTFAYMRICGGTSTIVYAFDTSSIPNGATIISVECTVKAIVSGTSSNITNNTIQLYANTTAKGTAATLPKTTATTIPTTVIASPGSWSLSEIRNIRVQTSASYNNNTAYYIRFYGASLTIKYTDTSSTVYIYTISNVSADHSIVISEASKDKMYTKINGSWVGLQKVHKKINGSWVEQTDLTNVFESDKIYVRN